MSNRSPAYLFLLAIPPIFVGASSCASHTGGDAAAKQASKTAAEPTSAAWMRQTPPTERTLLAPGVISRPKVHEFGCWTSADGRELFFGIELGKTAEIFSTRFVDGAWSEPTRLLTHARYRYHDPCLSRDGRQLYFISDRPIDGEGKPKDSDLLYIQREGSAWSEPIRMPETVNSPRNDYYTSFTSAGHVYFARNVGAGEGQRSNYDLFCARWIDGAYQRAEALPGLVNTGAYEADVFVAPDESWLIACSTRRSGFGRGDLYASVRDAKGKWSPLRNLGPKVNTDGHELCPFVTADGRWLIYTSKQEIVVIGTEGLGLPIGP